MSIHFRVSPPTLGSAFNFTNVKVNDYYVHVRAFVCVLRRIKGKGIPCTITNQCMFESIFFLSEILEQD